jgi:hypothetical protein
LACNKDIPASQGRFFYGKGGEKFMSFYTVEVGRRGGVSNRGEYPTSDDYYQASLVGVAPSEGNVMVSVEALHYGRQPFEISSQPAVAESEPTQRVIDVYRA